MENLVFGLVWWVLRTTVMLPIWIIIGVYRMYDGYRSHRMHMRIMDGIAADRGLRNRQWTVASPFASLPYNLTPVLTQVQEFITRSGSDDVATITLWSSATGRREWLINGSSKDGPRLLRELLLQALPDLTEAIMPDRNITATVQVELTSNLIA